jgi:hypothetical protein
VTVANIDRTGEIVSVLKEREPDVLEDAVTWAREARREARNPWLLGEHVEEALGRILAYRLSLAPDAEVRKSGSYVRAAMLKIQDYSSGTCARLGDRPNLLHASRKVPGPPDGASDPMTPYRSLLMRAYGEGRHGGWPKGIALPDVASPETWSRRGPPDRIPTTCREMIAWYDRVLEPGSKEGAREMRARFAAYAGVDKALARQLQASAAPGATQPGR